MGDMRNACKIFVKKLEGGDHAADLCVDGRIIRMDRREIGLEVVDWIHLAEDRDQWRVVVNTAMNLWVS
jgi:hypothetical protein